MTRIALLNESADFAARELARYMTFATGVTAEVVPDCRDADAVVGVLTDTARSVLPPQVARAAESIRDDGFAAGWHDGKIYFLGLRPRAALFAVYDWLEREMGFSFAVPGREDAPRMMSFAPHLALRVCQPRFPLRLHGWHFDWEHGPDVLAILDWVAKRGFSGIQVFLPMYEAVRTRLLPALRERDLTVCAGAHSAFFFMPPEPWRTTHPDWFARDEHGAVTGLQLCYSNPDMRAEFIRRLCDFARSRSEIDIMDLWPSDGPGECACPNCRREGFMHTVAAFVNEAATAVERVRPGLRVSLLAYYHYTRRSPDVNPASNVLIQHCDYWDRTLNRTVYDYRHGTASLHDEADWKRQREQGGAFRDHRDICRELAEWRRSGGQLAVFSYYSDLIMKCHLLTDVADAIRDDLDYYEALGLHGLIDCCCRTQYWEASGWNLYALSRFAWRAGEPRAELLSAYARGCVGTDSAPALVRFYDGLAELLNRPVWLGFNPLDLLHRHPRETAHFAGVVPELIEPVDKAFRARLDALSARLAEVGAKVRSEPAREWVARLNAAMTHLAAQWTVQFELYLAHAFRAQKDLASSSAHLRRARNRFDEFRTRLQADNGRGQNLLRWFDKLMAELEQK